VLIAGARDHHFPEEGEIIPIPYNSPLGKALLSHRVGDQFITQINGNQCDIAILRIRRPNRTEIINIFPALDDPAAR